MQKDVHEVFAPGRLFFIKRLDKFKGRAKYGESYHRSARPGIAGLEDKRQNTKEYATIHHNMTQYDTCAEQSQHDVRTVSGASCLHMFFN
jgi:hypothetical protein